MERRICRNWLEINNTFELINNQQDKLSGSMKYIADHLADLPVEHKSRLVSSTSDFNLSTELLDEIAIVKARTSSRMIHTRFKAAIKAAIEPRQETMPNKQPASQQVRQSTRRQPDSTPPDVAMPSNLKHQTISRHSVKQNEVHIPNHPPQ